MTFRVSTVTMLLLAAGLAAVAPPGRAQTPPAPAATTDAAMASQIESRITELRKRLHITAAQQPQWDAFAQVMRENAGRMEPFFRDPVAAQKLNAVESLRTYTAMAEEHAQGMERLLPAFEALYNAMSADQQRLADQAFRDFQQRLSRRGPPQP
jgi:primosomal protein N''